MKLEYQMIMWFFVLIAPIIGFAIYGVVGHALFADVYGPTGTSRPYKVVATNPYGFIMMIFEGLWVVGWSCVMFGDEPKTTENTKLVNGLNEA